MPPIPSDLLLTETDERVIEASFERQFKAKQQQEKNARKRDQKKRQARRLEIIHELSMGGSQQHIPQLPQQQMHSQMPRPMMPPPFQPPVQPLFKPSGMNPPPPTRNMGQRRYG